MAPISSHGSDASPEQVEQRAASRRPASAFSTITGLRLSPRGGDAVLINMSATGLLAECGERVQIGANITITFDGGFAPRTLQGRVARNSVASMGANGRLRYHVGIAFNERLALEEEPVPAAPDPPAAVEPPIAAAAAALAAAATPSAAAPGPAAPPAAAVPAAPAAPPAAATPPAPATPPAAAAPRTAPPPAPRPSAAPEVLVNRW